jgi:hypothetical protein
LKIGDKLLVIRTGAGQWQPTAVNLPENMKAAGIDPQKSIPC